MRRLTVPNSAAPRITAARAGKAQLAPSTRVRGVGSNCLLEGAERVLDALGIPPWRRTVGDEPAKALAIPSQDLVKRVDERRQSERAKDASERSGELDLGKEQEASTAVARDWSTVGEY